MSVEVRRYPGLQPEHNFRIIRLEPHLLGSAEGRVLRGRIMSDPEEAIAVLEPVVRPSRTEQVLIPEPEWGKSRRKIIKGLGVLVESPSENMSTVAILQLLELDSNNAEEIARQKVGENAARLLDRNREVSPGCDEIELTNLARLFRLGLRGADTNNPVIARAEVVADSVELLARGQLRNEVPTDIVGGDFYRGGIVNWWNRIPVVSNVARMTKPEIRESLYSQVDPSFFKVLGLKYKMMESGQLFKRLNPATGRFFGGLVPGMASAAKAEDLFLDKDHAQAKIAATLSQASYGEFEKLGVDAQKLQTWEKKLAEYTDRLEVLKDPKKFLLLADFQAALDQLVRAGQQQKIREALRERRN